MEENYAVMLQWFMTRIDDLESKRWADAEKLAKNLASDSISMFNKLEFIHAHMGLIKEDISAIRWRMDNSTMQEQIDDLHSKIDDVKCKEEKVNTGLKRSAKPVHEEMEEKHLAKITAIDNSLKIVKKHALDSQEIRGWIHAKTVSALVAFGFTYLEDLTDMDDCEILEIPGVGPLGVSQIRDALYHLVSNE